MEKKIFSLLENIKDTKLKSHFEQFYRNKLWKLGKNSYKINKKDDIKTDVLKNIKSKINIDLMEKIERKICSLIIKFPNIINILMEKYKIDIFSVNFLNDNCNNIISCIEECSNFTDNDDFAKKIQNLLVKNDLSTYIKDSDIFFNNFCVISLTEKKSVIMTVVLLLEKEVMLVEFDLKEASEIGDIIKAKKLGEELLSLKNKINNLLANGEFV